MEIGLFTGIISIRFDINIFKLTPVLNRAGHYKKSDEALSLKLNSPAGIPVVIKHCAIRVSPDLRNFQRFTHSLTVFLL